MAFRMLAEMRIDLYRKLDALSPAYLLRRRSGDLVSMATHDVELVEYFFAHTVAPAFVAVLVPAAVVGTLAYFGWPMALALLPLLAIVVVSPFLMRHRLDVLGSRGKLPVEVLPFGEALCRHRLRELGCEPALREADGAPYVTDNGNHILDCKIAPIEDAAKLEAAILAIPGVLGTGLFLGMADHVIVKRDDDAEILSR